MQTSSKIILGIDPGTILMGYGLLSIKGRDMQMLEMSAVKLSGHKDHYQRLQVIHQTVSSLITRFQPHIFAIEAPFYGKNVQSMLKLGRAQGVAIAAAMGAGVEVFEYSPRKIKQSVTGNGNADKEQVWKMLQRLLGLPPLNPTYLDASDALAVALCHHFQEKTLLNSAGKKLKNWEDFVAKNPGRIV